MKNQNKKNMFLINFEAFKKKICSKVSKVHYLQNF